MKQGLDGWNTYGRRAEESRKVRGDERKEFEEDLKWLMSSERGRRLAHWILTESAVFRTTFIETDLRANYMALAMAHDEGKKQFGYKLFAELNAVCPAQYALMMKEKANA